MKRSQVARRTVQSLVLIWVLIMPAVIWWSRRPLIGSEQAPFRTWFQGFRGNTWAVDLFGMSVMDPLAAVESAVAGDVLWSRIFMGLSIPVLATLIFGRFFCSWICPAGFLFELNEKLWPLLKRLGFRRPYRKFNPKLRYHILGIGLLMSAALSWPLLSHFYPPAILARESNRLAYGMMETTGVLLTGGMLFVCALLVIELTVSKRLWCRVLCPGGALYSLIGSKRPVRVRLNEPLCTKCADCVTVCPMGLNPMQNHMGAACDNCLLCVSVCDHQALALSLPARTRVEDKGLDGKIL